VTQRQKQLRRQAIVRLLASQYCKAGSPNVICDCAGLYHPLNHDCILEQTDETKRDFIRVTFANAPTPSITSVTLLKTRWNQNNRSDGQVKAADWAMGASWVLHSQEPIQLPESLIQAACKAYYNLDIPTARLTNLELIMNAGVTAYDPFAL
jgi:hypothetical protein